MNSVDAAVAAAIAGLGVVRTLSYQVADPIAAGKLRQLLADEPSPALPVSLLFQGVRRDQPNIRAFVDAARRRAARAGL